MPLTWYLFSKRARFRLTTGLPVLIKFTGRDMGIMNYVKGCGMPVTFYAFDRVNPYNGSFIERRFCVSVGDGTFVPSWLGGSLALNESLEIIGMNAVTNAAKETS